MKPHTKQCWCIPPHQSGEFVAAMEDVLELYHQPYDPAHPVICMDETNKQLVGETRRPVPARPGQARRIDYEYERRGTADVFLFTEPLGNWRCVDITETRTRIDWAHQIKNLVDVYYPPSHQDPAGDGQSEYSLDRFALRSVSSRRCASDC